MVGNRAKGSVATSPSLTDHAGRALDWWLGELSAAVPNRLRATFAARQATIVCALGENGHVACGLNHRNGALPKAESALAPGDALEACLRELAAKVRRRTVRLLVPQSLCLLRRSRLPARALPHAGAILRHEVETLMPLAAADILADWFVEGEEPETGEVHVVQVVLSRSRIAELEEAMGRAGLRLTHLTAGDAEGAPLPVDLLAGRKPSLRGAVARLPASAKLVYATAATLLVAVPFLADARQTEALAVLAQVPRLSPAAQSAAGVAGFIEAGAARVPTVAVLDELARRLPQGASLADFHQAGGRVAVMLRGAGIEAAKAALSASPLFHNVEAEAGAEPSGEALRLRFELAARSAAQPGAPG